MSIEEEEFDTREGVLMGGMLGAEGERAALEAHGEE